jgi:perosamine synthetase
VIAVGEPLIGEAEEKLVLEVLRSGRLVQGPMVERFEAAVAAVAGTRHALAVNSGTSALIAALIAHDIGPGDEVITSPFTFIATVNAILLVGASPRFVDVGPDLNLDAGLLTDAIGPATRAVLPVHLFGCPADMDAVMAAVAGHDVAVIEDAAQALGAAHGDRSVGSFGTGCFSFYATKNITTGEGGVVTTDDDAVADVVRLVRNQGQRSLYAYERPGFNFRMTELQAALGVAQTDRLTDIVETRRANARVLSDALRGIDGLILPEEPLGRRHIFHQYTVRVAQDGRVDRDILRRFLSDRGIGTGIYYPKPVFGYPAYRSDPRMGDPRAPMAERASREVLSLPVHPKLTSDDLDRIANAVREAMT